MAKKQHYLKERERYKMEAWLQDGVSKSEIARRLGVCRQTIYNEYKRGLVSCVRNPHGIPIDTIEYSADKAQQIHNYNQTAKGRPLKIGNDHAFANYIEGLILGRQPDGRIDRDKRYSPAVALALARREGYTTRICTSTLYSYIHKQVFLTATVKDLWAKPKKRKKDEDNTRTAHPKLPSIEDRPREIWERREPGHWEMDLIIGKQNTTACLMTLYERYSRQFLIFKLPNRQAATVRAVFDKLEVSTPRFKERFKTITTDNGSEFLEYEKLRQSIWGGVRFQVYYCHPYSAWEKGGIENHNRIVRRWYPKGTDFTKVTKKRLRELETWMNSYPRKILGWATPNEKAA